MRALSLSLSLTHYCALEADACSLCGTPQNCLSLSPSPCQEVSMATERVNKPPSLPEYPEMILEAIDALKQKEGSNKSAISKYIESKYGNLSEAHSKLLTFHLDSMKQRGDLIFSKNNYIKPGPDAPPKRGRGRPPKPKAPLPPGTIFAPPRPRGRPRKDPNAPPTPKKAKPAAPSPSTVSKTGRPRGRPRKVKPQAAQNGAELA